MYIKKVDREKFEIYKQLTWNCTTEKLERFLKECYIEKHFFTKINEKTFKCTDGYIVNLKSSKKINDLIYHKKNKRYYPLLKKNANPHNFYRYNGCVNFVDIVRKQKEKLNIKWSFLYSRYLNKQTKEYEFKIETHPYYLNLFNQSENFFMSCGMFANQTGYYYSKKSEWRIPTKSCTFLQKGFTLQSKSFLKQYPFLGYDYIPKNKTHLILFEDFFKQSLVDKNIEKLVKMGFWNLLGKSRIEFNFNGKSFKQITGLNKEYHVLMQNEKYGYKLHDLIKKYDIPVEISFNLLKLIYNHIFYEIITTDFFKNLSKNKKHKVLNYLSENSYNLIEYRDLLRWLKDLGYPIRNEYFLPKDLKLMHDQIEKEYADKKDKIFNDKIKKNYQILSKFIFEEKDFIIEPFESQDELIEESKHLGHCIRTYAKDYAYKETELYKIRLKNNKQEPYYSLEFKDGKVQQCRTTNNKSATPEIEKFYEKWVKEIRLKEKEEKK